MKRLTRIVALVFLGAACYQAIKAQSTAPWVEVSPGDELFRFSMPRQPEQEDQKQRYGEIRVNGKRYATVAGGASYTVWSLENTNYHPVSSSDVDAYLDTCADLVWESLLEPARDNLPKDGRIRTGMTYVKELATKPLSGREYSITLGELTGTIRFYLANARIYILLAMNTTGGPWETEKFFQSFTMKPSSPIATLDADPLLIGPGIRGATSEGDTDYNPVFGARETMERVRILDKPEPTYTESARKYGVQGTVILRAVFSKEGQVTNIIVLRKLPHGLTPAAIAATQHIRFTPAIKDGRTVSQYMQLEYNFNLY